ncbi:MAG: DMT family transporter [Kiritimatiellae bacterium]|nr:DMT family transporter [Kiritimatiellia bacterium]
MAEWASWVLASAVLLALYDLAKKASVGANAVLPVLLASTVFGFAAYAAGLLATGHFRALGAVSGAAVSLGIAKSVIVGTSWVFTFCALRTLPITIATPIRASAPALVLLIAVPLYGEMPSPIQGVGMAAVFVGYFAFSWAGRHEGIDFFRSRAVWCAIAGAVLSAVSSIWDKYVFQVRAMPVEQVQLVFQAGLVAFYAPALAASRALRLGRDAFEWRWTIPLVGILLAGADWLYFKGVAHPGSPISAASLMRRLSVVLTFLLGARFFHETNLVRKGIALAAIVIGVSLLALAS